MDAIDVARSITQPLLVPIGNGYRSVATHVAYARHGDATDLEEVMAKPLDDGGDGWGAFRRVS